MLPTAISLDNFRAFAQPTCLELRPITLLFGNNNSGKSALLRALPLLEASVAPDATAALDFACPAARGATFQDLRWKGLKEDEDPDLGVGFRWDRLRVEFRLTWFSEWRRVMIRRMKLLDDSGKELIEAEWEPRPEEQGEAQQSYLVGKPSARDEARRVLLGFQGLVPVSFPEDDLAEPLGELRDHLRAVQGQVQWLQAARRPPERLSAAPAAPRRRLRPDGQDAAAALFSDPMLLRTVSGWYERHLGKRLHESEVPSEHFRLMLRNLQRPELDVDLVDSGEGMTQVLAVLTALSLSQTRDRPKILAIEEPESHLHPALQRALASHLGELIGRDPSPRVVLETHSEQLLLGIQLEVVRGSLRPEDIRVYWVHQLETGESLAEAVNVDSDAHLQDNWPPGVFSHDTEVAREIIRERKGRRTP